MYLSFEETRPFTKFVEIELERDELYRSFTDLDEPKEISQKWIVFAESCSKNLSAINSLASMAFERLESVYDLVSKKIKNKTNPLPLHTLLYGDIANQMLTLTEFQLRLGVLIYVYSQVRNRGVFSYSPEEFQYNYYILAKETLDNILYRILNKELPDIENTPSPASIQNMLDVLMPLLKLEHRKRLIPTLKEIPEHDEDPYMLRKIGDYDRLQGITLMSNILDIVNSASEDFWWADPISTLSILDHAMEHFNTVVELWQEKPGELAAHAAYIQQDYIPVCNSSRFIAQSNHYSFLAKSALEIGDLPFSADYFEKALEKLENAKKITGENNPSAPSPLLDTIEEEKKEIKNMSILSRLAVIYDEIVEKLTQGEAEDILIGTKEIADLVEELKGSGAIPYLYGMSVSYAAASSGLVEVIEKDISNLAIIDRLISQFSFPLKAMKEAIKAINVSKIKVEDENPLQSYNFLEELENKVTYLEKAIEILPSFLEEKDKIRKKIHAILYYIRSMLSENKIYLHADNNIVLDLILRARAHYFAKKAEQNIAELEEQNLEQLIKKRILETKSAGILTETNLVSLGLQSSYSNTVRNVVEQILVLYSQIEKPPEFILESVKKQFENMTDFRELLNLMEVDNNELFAMKQDTSIKGHEINWAFVERRESFIPATRKMFQTIEDVILGELAADLGKRSEALKYYDNAKRMLYDVSDILSKIAQYIDDKQELPQLIYSLALFTQENQSAIRDRRKRNEVPYKDIIGILDYLTLNL